jgi:hypothetical protein
VQAGDNVQIRFSSSYKALGSGIDTAQLKFSADGGANWEVAANLTELDFSAGYVNWTVPAVPTSSAMLRVCIRDLAGNEGSAESEPFTIDSTVAVGDGIPERSELAGNYPNPFNPRTTIQYSLARDSWVRLDIFDSRGRSVRLLVDQKEEAGERRVVWDGLDEVGRQVPSGVYFYRLQAGQLDETRRMVLVK